MFEVVLTNDFKKFQTKFNFVITEKISFLSSFKNFALESHFISEYCAFFVNKERKLYYNY